ncbi:hypothetical protein GF362_01305 [Candidatus Dojkabacteria bacterium]|nr:hypothetical protein [Candidatus Dojkabacteria bacterium]
MKVPWKLIIFMAFVVTLAVTMMDFTIAMDTDPNVAQYSVTEVNTDIGSGVLQHIADSSELIYYYTDEIGK